MRARGGFLALVALLAALAAALFSHDNRLTADGIDHYVYLRSLWVDHDLDLGNDYEAVTRGRAADLEKTPLGRVANPHPIGPAIVWAPFYAAAELVTRLRGGSAGGADPSLDSMHRGAIALASLLYGWLGLVLLYHAARRLAGDMPALLSALGIGLATFLYWYLVHDSAMAHAPAFAAAALVVWLWLRPAPAPRSIWRAVALGAACGLAALLRWQAALLFVVVLADAIERAARRESAAAVLRDVAAAGLAALIVFTPQLVVFKLLYGSWFTIPQGTRFLAGNPAWSGVLFSPHHGLFSWSPFLYCGAAGFLLWLRRAPAQALTAFVVFLLCARLNAGVGDWWGGSAFGGRRFDIVLPFFGIATALFFQWAVSFVARRPAWAVAAACALFASWNLLLVSNFRTGVWDYSGPVTFEEMGRGVAGTVDRTIGSPFSLPGALWERLRRGRALADYESAFTERPFSRWSARFGIDDRIFLEDGWSAALLEGGVSFRSLLAAEGGFVVPLHRPAAYRLGVRARGPGGDGGGLSVRVFVNQRPAGVWALAPEWTDFETAVPAELLRPGRNFFRLRILSGGTGGVDVAGAWLAPLS